MQASTRLLKTTVFISNIHCATCTELIATTLGTLTPRPVSHTASILSNRVEIYHSVLLKPSKIVHALHLVGFDIESCLSGPNDEESRQVLLQKPVYFLEEFCGGILSGLQSKKRKRHEEICGRCISEKPGSSGSVSGSFDAAALARPGTFKSYLSGDAHDSGAPSGSATPALEKRDIVDLRSIAVGTDASSSCDKWVATFSIQGMTCSACVNTIRQNLKKFPYIEKAEISALSHSGKIVFSGKDNGAIIAESIEDSGYDVEIIEVVPYNAGEFQTSERTITLEVQGIHCPNCPPRLMAAMETFKPAQLTVVKPMISLNDPTIVIKYTPQPDINARKVISKLSAVDTAFTVKVKPPQSIEDRSASVHKAEVRRIRRRLAISIICAIPGFIIGIVFMSLLPKDNEYRIWSEKPIWKGNVSVAEWSLLIISTPVYFFAADLFHVRAIQELRGLWSRKNSKPTWMKFLKFGSMNLLMSLGTTIAYFASIALLAISASERPWTEIAEEQAQEHHHHPGADMNMDMGQVMKKSEIAHATYFDAVIFLTMFLLIGRLLESYSKEKTANAVNLLGNLRPKDANLITERTEGKSPNLEVVPVELLEVGDLVQVTHGQSPPLDGKIVTGEGKFDESALTGESRLVPKAVGDDVFAGTINQGQPVTVEVKNISGRSMLDDIVQIVREGQAQRAPIERVADFVTGYFVPIISYLAVLTWVIWLSLGYSGALPEEWLEGNQGGWALWSMSFAIAVFVIACPCGIGLAAPTALFIGTGLAAKYGILAKGGGEAFQEASWLDAIVFDKTGTLTMGGQPEVVDAIVEDQIYGDEKLDWKDIVLGIAEGLESASGHPLAKAVLKYTHNSSFQILERTAVEEIPGRGVSGSFKIGGASVDAIIGNESFMEENGIQLSDTMIASLNSWKSEAKSIVILAVHNITGSEADFPGGPRALACFCIADQIRPEAAYTISELGKLGVNVYMITGDNAVTAAAVAKTVGIPSDNVIAGVLPQEKAERIKYLQQTARLRRRSAWSTMFHRNRKQMTSNTRPRVAMVGDGINDSPALITADVGIAIGSGSDIALSSAGFILLREDLRQVLLLLNLASKVIRRVKFNFFWAVIYNVIGVPIAAGVLYGYRRTRLDPSWAALAMACSSVSVVCSSLLLRSKVPLVGFRAKKGWKA